MVVASGWKRDENRKVLVKRYEVWVMEDESFLLPRPLLVPRVTNTIVVTLKVVKRVDLILTVLLIIVAIINKQTRRKLLEMMDMVMAKIVVLVSWVYYACMCACSVMSNSLKPLGL